MGVTVKKVKDVAVAEVSGEIDGSTAPAVQQQIRAAASENQKIVLDLTNVPYMSSAGLRMLLSTYRQVTGNGGRVVLVGVAPEIRDTMEITGFLRFFTLLGTVEDAVAALA
jgi:anti-sigma B factor antagonist